MKLASRPYRLYCFNELPSSYDFDPGWETEDDTWFKRNGAFYNLKEFCTVGMPTLPLARGGAQTASNGYFMIAGWDGEVWAVIEEKQELKFRPTGKAVRL